MKLLFFVTGASGSGKTASLNGLCERTNILWYDSDSIGVPPNPTKAWRQSATESWIQRAIEQQLRGHDFGICGQLVYGEILACTSTPRLDGLAVCLLDCDDVVRIDRMRSSGKRVDQDRLNWAAWLRMHAIDPQWQPDVIRDGSAPELQWERWETWKRGDPRWQVWTLDTTTLSINETVDRISEWVREEKEKRRELTQGRHA